MPKRSLAPQRGFFPQPSYLIGTFKDDGTPNFALITWVTFCSVNPPILMFASRGKKLTRELVEKNGVFSANLVSTEMMYMADYFGNASGYNKNKCDDIGAKYIKGMVLNVPALEKSPWVYECAVIEMIPRNRGCIYIGEIKNILVDEAIRDTAYGKIDLLTVDPLIYAPGKYYKIGASIGTVGVSKS
ncbi:flavin reductase family protein [Sporolactobacillus laevolacticus]|uniref:flavin reductase family protein n=1 Tax=Sporolactobacillus laevolacticus TaxID=33018 RepID=UPI0025B535E0|nr:flavin reductase family protein [Sporolactobacillus laevolacticus]MDN3956330.1 flavin reductase family protein [Sporolactobacillus laevolacticus]